MCFYVFIHSNLFNSVFFPLIIETRVVTLTCYETSAFIFQSVPKKRVKPVTVKMEKRTLRAMSPGLLFPACIDRPSLSSFVPVWKLQDCNSFQVTGAGEVTFFMVLLHTAVLRKLLIVYPSWEVKAPGASAGCRTGYAHLQSDPGLHESESDS